MHRPRPRTVAAGALVLLLAAAPFIPRGADDDGSITPSSNQPRFAPREASAVGYTAVTPAMRREIARVADATAALPQLHGRITPGAASALTRCADFDGQRYCIGQGWTEDAAADVQARVAADVTTPVGRRATGPTRARVNTGDLSPQAMLRQYAALTPQQRARKARAELTEAARSVAKVWMLRHEIEGVPLPADFLATHPEARVSVPTVAARAATTTTTTAPSKSPTVLPVGATSPKAPTTTAGAPRTATATPSTQPSATASVSTTVAASVPVTYRRRARVLSPKQTAEQIRTYWCGPTSMQMIAWGWKHKDKGAAFYANKLHTTTAGTSVWDMVRVTNQSTGWDTKAGPYIVLDVKHYSTAQWWSLIQRHIAQYRAPIILHPQLLTTYFPYLPYSGSGHFQVGRGYRTTADGVKEIGYFEPWNPHRFHPSVPNVGRVQWLPADRELGAIKANAFHNVGV